MFVYFDKTKKKKKMLMIIYLFLAFVALVLFFDLFRKISLKKDKSRLLHFDPEITTYIFYEAATLMGLCN